MEDRTDSLSRLTTLIMVSTGVAMEKGAISQDSGTIILACNSLGIALVYVYTLGPLRVVTSLVAYAKVQRNAAAWADRDADSIAKLTDVEIVGMSTAHLERASSSQLCLVYARAMDIEMDLSQLNIVVIPMGRDGASQIQLSILTRYPSPVLDLANIGLDEAQALAVSRWLTTIAAASITSCCILNNPLGEVVNEIIKVFQDSPRLRTLCGFEEGIEEVDWSNSEKGVADVTLLAAELSADRAIGSINSLTCDSTGVPARYSYGDLVEGTGPRTYTLAVGEAVIDLSQKNFGPADVNLLTTWIQRPEVSNSLTKVVITGAEISETDVATLRAAAPNGCEVVW